MAGSENTTPDQEASKWFRAAIIGTILYVSAVFAFIIMSKVGNEAARDEAAKAVEHSEQEHGQPD